jgi:hypothetical protein
VNWQLVVVIVWQLISNGLVTGSKLTIGDRLATGDRLVTSELANSDRLIINSERIIVSGKIIYNERITGNRVVIGGGMVISSKKTLGGVIRDTNLVKITIDLNTITISTTCRVIADIEILSEYIILKKKNVSTCNASKVMKMKIQSTLVNSSL